MEDKIERLVEDAFAELGYDDCFIVDIKLNNTKVEIYLDSDSSITFERCRRVSRMVEAVLDEEQWLGEKYMLDVSSAGVGKPLKFTRQYVKNIGRTVEVKTHDGEKVKGVLTAANDEQIVVTYDERVKEGKKKKKITVNREISMESVKETKIKVSFQK